MKKLLLILAAIVLVSVLFSSCQPSKFIYGSGTITVYKGRLHSQFTNKPKVLPDTTMQVMLIRRMQP